MDDDNKRIWLQFMRSKVKSVAADKDDSQKGTENTLNFHIQVII